MSFDFGSLIIGIFIGVIGSPIVMKLLKKLKDKV